MYDYTAADDDEVSFQEGKNVLFLSSPSLSLSLLFSTGDAIIDVEVIDDGWMEGTVERTGQKGMLPSNYVEKK